MAKLRFINQYTPNREAVIAFYENVIGLKSDWPGKDWYGFEPSLANLAIEPERNREDLKAKYRANWQNPYLVQVELSGKEEMQQVLDRAKAANITVLSKFEKTHYGMLSKLLDPDNNLVELLYDYT
jgi:predicted enzyme related to lactoylglutathione lyase